MPTEALPLDRTSLPQGLGAALWRGVRDDWNEEQRRERAMRRRMREMVDAPGR